MEFSIAWLAISIVALIGGAILGFQLAKKAFVKQLRDNPPISEKQIRAMYASMGRKPSEAQIQNTLRSVGINKK